MLIVMWFVKEGPNKTIQGCEWVILPDGLTQERKGDMESMVNNNRGITRGLI